LEYAIRFGGWDNDVAYGIAVNAQGYATVAGATDSHDFPQFGSPRPVSGGFAAKLLPDGSGFVYSTYLFGIGTGIDLCGIDGDRAVHLIQPARLGGQQRSQQRAIRRDVGHVIAAA